MTEICAVIPARGGSKGIPRKNLRLVDGRSLLAHSIDHARASSRVSRIVVSTEDPEIARIARENGAEVPFMRPSEFASDDALDLPVFRHALMWLKEREQYEPDVVVHLRPTAPLRTPRHIDEAVDLLLGDPRADSVRSVSCPSQHPYRMFLIGEEGYLRPLLQTDCPEPYVLRRQDLPTVYWYNCVVDVTRPATILHQDSMTGARILPYILDPRVVVDIDGPEDLAYAELLLKRTRV